MGVDARDRYATPRPARSSRGFRPQLRLTPARAGVAIALAGSTLFVVIGFFDRGPTQVPILVSGLAVLGLTFGALAAAGGITAYRGGTEGRTALAFWSALLGGIAALGAFGCLAAATVLALLWQSAPGS